MKKWLFLGYPTVVERIEGVRQIYHQPAKHPSNPVLKPDKEWEEGRAYAYGRGSVVRDPETGNYRLWYQAGTEGFLICYATSLDGLAWEKPSLGVTQHRGSADNNIVLGGEYCAHNPSVIRDDAENILARRYKMLYWDGGEEFVRTSSKERMGLHVAFSPDGIHWTPSPRNPVLAEPAVGDVKALMGWDPTIRRWVATTKRYRLTPPIRTVNRTESEDFLHWSEPTCLLVPDDRDEPRCEFYGMPMMRYAGIYLGFLWIYHNAPEDQRIDVQLACSEDGVTWQRAGNRETFLPVGPGGAWDDGMVYCTQPVVCDDQIRLYYAGSNHRHRAPTEDEDPDARRSCTGLATLRIDGFSSMRAGEDGGVIMTRPHVFVPRRVVDPSRPRRLRVNADAAKGRLRAELLEGGRPVEGFSLEKCSPLTADSTSQILTWGGVSDLSVFAGKAVQLRFALENTDLYSFWIEDNDGADRH